MTTLRLRFVQAFTDRHGRDRHYFRRKGSNRIPLPGLPGSAEFMAAYQAALAGQTAPAHQIGAERSVAGSMGALIAAYYQSAEFRNLAPLTQRTYRNMLDRVREEHGEKPVARLEPKHIHRMIDARASRPGSANNLLKRLHGVMKFAVERGWRRDDPTVSVRKLRTRTVGFRSWTEEDIAAFERRWPDGSRARLALRLLLYTAQRRSDVVRMGRQHMQNGQIAVRQQKTGTALLIPVHPTLQSELDRLPRDQMVFLLTGFGKPFSPAGFTNWFSECAKDAGLPPRSSPHGLRKAAARRLAEQGCSAHQIMSITGHKTLSEVAHYTAAADQERLARTAVDVMPSKPRETER
ncbi:MAG: site-specific integrase [Caulobacter sp.]|nr:site-specific integrase [Caulobacter sp.]